MSTDDLKRCECKRGKLQREFEELLEKFRELESAYQASSQQEATQLAEVLEKQRQENFMKLLITKFDREIQREQNWFVENKKAVGSVLTNDKKLTNQMGSIPNPYQRQEFYRTKIVPLTVEFDLQNKRKLQEEIERRKKFGSWLQKYLPDNVAAWKQTQIQMLENEKVFLNDLLQKYEQVWIKNTREKITVRRKLWDQMNVGRNTRNMQDPVVAAEAKVRVNEDQLLNSLNIDAQKDKFYFSTFINQFANVLKKSGVL